MNFKTQFIILTGLLALLCVELPGTVRGDTFTYTSNAYNFCYGTYCSITGPITETLEFTTTLTGAALDNAAVDIPAAEITAFSFTDSTGLTLTQADVGDPGFFDFFEIITDGTGNITQWFIDAGYLNAPGLEPGVFSKDENILLDTSGSPIVDEHGQPVGGGYGSLQNSASTWTDITTATNTPEPPSLLLLGVGLFGVFAFDARKKVRAAQASC